MFTLVKYVIVIVIIIIIIIIIIIKSLFLSQQIGLYVTWFWLADMLCL